MDIGENMRVCGEGHVSSGVQNWRWDDGSEGVVREEKHGV